MASTDRELGIWANGARVGTWRISGRATMEFQYESTWLEMKEAQPLSLSLPLPFDATPYKGPVVEAYFDNLLPESEPIRRRIQERFHVATRGPFDLLAAVGRDCVGAIQVIPSKEAPARADRTDAVALSDEEVAKEISWVTTTRSLVREEDQDFRISIAGAQEKTAFTWHKGRWCRPVGTTPTTHIFKLPLGIVSKYQADMRQSVENEWLCSRLIHALGLPVAETRIEQFDAHKVLVVERFDRQLHDGGRYWRRIMQEDFCQATGTPWHRKYQSDGGPGLLQIAEVLQSSIEAQRDLMTLFNAQLAFFLLAAIDGHAKNFSIRLLPGGRLELTPLYDVISAWPVIGKKANQIPAEKVKMAMALPGERQHYLMKNIQRRHFEELGKRIGLASPPGELMDAFMAKIPAAINAVQRELPRGFPQALLDRICGNVEKSARVLAAR
jgi:serine/threonine-protein kinase HipA